MHEIMIIGAGPAGLSAAIYASRKRLHTIMLSKDIGGQINWTLSIENYLGYQFISAQELIAKFKEQVDQFPIDEEIGVNIIKVRRGNGFFEAVDDAGNIYQAKAVIYATGKKPKRLSVPGEMEYTGKGVSYCSICDGPLFSGQNVAVIGGGNSAAQAALDMVKIASRIYLVTDKLFTCDTILSEKILKLDTISIFTGYNVEKIEGNVFVTGLTIKEISTGKQLHLDATGVFVEIGLIPNSEPAEPVAKFNELREIAVSCTNDAGVPGFYAAGDVTDVPEKQILIAAGEGAKAALRAHKYLLGLKD